MIISSHALEISSHAVMCSIIKYFESSHTIMCSKIISHAFYNKIFDNLTLLEYSFLQIIYWRYSVGVEWEAIMIYTYVEEMLENIIPY